MSASVQETLLSNDARIYKDYVSRRSGSGGTEDLHAAL